MNRSLLGILLSLAAAASFATNSTLASIAYDNGATPLSVATYRTVLAAVVLFIILRIWRVPISLSPTRRWQALGLGFLLAIYSFGLLGAVERIPVALAVLIFYLYPLLTAVGAWATGQERMTLPLGIALVSAFVGLGLVLNTGRVELDGIGILLALGAAIFNTALVLLNRRMVGGTDSRPISLYMLISAAVLFGGADLFVGEFPLPQTAVGVAAFLGVGLFYAFSIITFFVAISMIGPIRNGIFMNFEPVTSVFLGIVLLGQALAPFQFLGAAIVIGAIVFAALNKAGAVKTS